MIELSANAKQSVSNAQETATTAQKMKFDAQEGNSSVVLESIHGIKSLRETVLKTVTTIDNLGINANKIGDIVKVIREITNKSFGS